MWYNVVVIGNYMGHLPARSEEQVDGPWNHIFREAMRCLE
jgi:hypothetical protein